MTSCTLIQDPRVYEEEAPTSIVQQAKTRCKVSPGLAHALLQRRQLCCTYKESHGTKKDKHCPQVKSTVTGINRSEWTAAQFSFGNNGTNSNEHEPTSFCCKSPHELLLLVSIFTEGCLCWQTIGSQKYVLSLHLLCSLILFFCQSPILTAVAHVMFGESWQISLLAMLSFLPATVIPVFYSD